MRTTLFGYSFRAAGALDIGLVRDSNQDQVIISSEQGFCAVSDGMGGLLYGGETSEMVARVMPELIVQNAVEVSAETMSLQETSLLLAESVEVVSNNIAEVANEEGYTGFGATISGVWLVGTQAIFVNLGDSRGYMLDRYGRTLRQITEDHNIAQLLVNSGELTREEARHHETSSQLTRFVGMPPPAKVDVFIEDVEPGDRILLCSDGLYGEVEDADIKKILRSSRSPHTICSRLISAAKNNGGRDNISAVYLQVGK